MIKEEYIQFETAKLLKEAGFPQDYGYKYNDDDGILCPTIYDCIDMAQLAWAAPPQSHAMRWLRESQGIHLEIVSTIHGQYLYRLKPIKRGAPIDTDIHARYPTYETAAEAGIQAACRYLIEHDNHELLNQ